ncbi:hypothetical protein, partial [Paraburkholderia sp. UYCP14C]|uniref:hypothetical protein n=1 Tax=Paraburkholderia sp. UYCP14C TaxID=2511130 RepID=UPI001B7D4BA8
MSGAQTTQNTTFLFSGNPTFLFGTDTNSVDNKDYVKLGVCCALAPFIDTHTSLAMSVPQRAATTADRSATPRARRFRREQNQYDWD